MLMFQPATMEMPTVEPQHMQCVTYSAYGGRDHGEGDRVKYDAADGADASASNDGDADRGAAAHAVRDIQCLRRARSRYW